MTDIAWIVHGIIQATNCQAYSHYSCNSGLYGVTHNALIVHGITQATAKPIHITHVTVGYME